MGGLLGLYARAGPSGPVEHHGDQFAAACFEKLPHDMALGVALR